MGRATSSSQNAFIWELHSQKSVLLKPSPLTQFLLFGKKHQSQACYVQHEQCLLTGTQGRGATGPVGWLHLGQKDEAVPPKQHLLQLEEQRSWQRGTGKGHSNSARFPHALHK